MPAQSKGPVRFARRGDIGVVTIDNPPVNALSAEVREDLLDALGRAGADGRVRAVVLAATGKVFIAGADIREFGRPPQDPILPEVVAAMDRFGKPLVAAIHGTVLGGGLEVALACHRRVATQAARFGFPEVGLGLIPGAGGTQRLARLAGIEEALEIVTSGTPFPAKRARELGIVDGLVKGSSPMRAAFAAARELVSEGGPLPRVSRLRVGARKAEAEAAVRKFEGELRKRKPGLAAPVAGARAIAASVLPFVEGLRRERELFLRCRRSAQRKALVHLFFAERQAAKPPVDAVAREIKTAAVVGGGAMGAGIAVCLADSGTPTTLLEADDAALESGLRRVRAVFEHREKSGRMPPAEASRRLSLVRGGRIADIGGADLVIEAVPEKMRLKRDIFSALGQGCKPTAILATNTSSLDVDRIARATPRPENVLGMHFFMPAQRMRLLEVVRARRTSPGTLATVVRFAKTLGKVPVTVGVCPGFVGNRLYLQYGREAEFLLEEGSTPEEVDSVMRSFGMAMGPFEARDLSGIDNGHNIRAEAWAGLPAEYPRPLVLEKLHRAGRLGQKAGAGYYRYEPGSRKPIPDPETMAIIREASAERGIRRRKPDRKHILERCLYALVNEGDKVLEEGIARSPDDIDVIYVLGYGFPAHRGGPMHHARHIGIDRVRKRIADFHRRFGAWWRPTGLRG